MTAREVHPCVFFDDVAGQALFPDKGDTPTVDMRALYEHVPAVMLQGGAHVTAPEAVASAAPEPPDPVKQASPSDYYRPAFAVPTVVEPGPVVTDTAAVDPDDPEVTPTSDGASGKSVAKKSGPAPD